MNAGEIWLPSIFSDNMMLQADVPLLIWGRSEKRQRVEVDIAGIRRRATADAKGDFKVQLPPLKAGGPHLMRIRGRTERTIENVLVGDVWLCSGQSNMAWSVRGSRNAEGEISGARFSRIRIFTVPAQASLTPRDDVQGSWLPCSPQTIGNFSATAFFFGRKLHQELNRPIGLINSSWGGTRIEPWISMASLKKYADFSRLIQPYRKDLTPAKASDTTTFHVDRCNMGAPLGWAVADGPPEGWRKIKLPGYWTRQGINKVGAFWFRKSITIPESWRGEDLYLALGPIVDFDTTYFNGVKIGGIGIETPGFWDVPRKYVIPEALVKPGRNLVAVRVFAHNINGGFGGPKEVMQLSVINKKSKGVVPLAGNWEYKIERALPRKERLSQAVVPGTLFNAMIHPLTAFPVKGFLWYQGESNIDAPQAYRELFPLLIKDWRGRWGNNALPFYFAQLPDYTPALRDNLPVLREAQTMALKVPNTGMAVIVDGGENDVHPRHKQLVGERLALVALAKTYGKKVRSSGPVFRGAGVEGRRIRVRFDQAEGLNARGGKGPGEFVIAGTDRRFVTAHAKIEGRDVLVWSDEVPAPTAVRYAWGCAPRCTLYNKAGLPAVPFRTDKW